MPVFQFYRLWLLPAVTGRVPVFYIFLHSIILDFFFFLTLAHFVGCIEVSRCNCNGLVPDDYFSYVDWTFGYPLRKYLFMYFAHLNTVLSFLLSFFSILYIFALLRVGFSYFLCYLSMIRNFSIN